MVTLNKVSAEQILDSRGNPTVQVTASAGKGEFTSQVPSGASTGKHEALELRDGGKAFGGKGVLKAVSNVNGPIAQTVCGAEFSGLREIDSAMILRDGTPNKSALGANAILGVSMATARLISSAADSELFQFISSFSGRKPVMPTPLLNIINGGVHAGGELAVQEFLIVPSGFGTFSDALRCASEIYQQLKTHLRKKYGPFAVNIGDEGGFVPPVSRTDEALDAIMAAISESGYSPGKDVYLALDPAASEFYKGGRYHIDGMDLAPAGLSDHYLSLASKYPIVSVEDPFDQDAFDDFASFCAKSGNKLQIIGDDLYVTNATRIRRGIDKKSTNAVLIKLNQIGTVSETVDSSLLAMEAGMNTVVSHRSGETADDFIADLAVGLGTGQIKTGAPARGERVVKYNRLLEIERKHPELGFAGHSPFSR